MTNAINRAQFAISNTPGTSGDFTVSSAQADYRTLGAAQDGLVFDGVLIVESGLGWEVRNGCTYTNGTTTLGRGVLEDSSSGSAIDFTSAAIVSIGASARSAKNATLTHVAGSDADTTMSVGSLYVVDMSAWSTADRNYTLPATAAVGDRIGVLVKAGSATKHVILKANTGDTLNGIAAAEWSRLFISNEIVIMRCVEANTAWIVERDGRIPCHAVAELTTAVDATNASMTWLAPTDDGGAWTNLANVGGCMSSTATFTSRRAGKYRLAIKGVSSTSGTEFSIGVSIGGNAPSSGAAGTFMISAKDGSVIALGTPIGDRTLSLPVGTAAQWQWRHSAANSALTAVGWNTFDVTEVLAR